MEQAGFTKAVEVVREVKIGKSAVSRILSGTLNPSPRTLELFRRIVADKKAGVIPQRNQSGGVGNSTDKRVLLQRAEREKMFSLHEQPSGRSYDPEIQEMITAMELLREVDPPAYNHLKDYITVCRNRVVHDSQQSKKKK